jgi:UDP-N-acetylglucosamine 3-dehydrogenase
MSAKIKCAVIGAGKMGINHVRIYSELKQVQLVAVADLNEKLGKDASIKYNTKYYSSYKEMIIKEKPDIISICVPTSFHYIVAKDCLMLKKNILLEKPISTTVEEAKKLVALAKKNKVHFMVGHIERYNPAVIKVKELIKKGELGKITSIIARRIGGFPYRIRDANIMVDLAIHDIDIVNYLLDEYPKQIFVNKKRIHTKTREDSVEFFLKYKIASAYIQSNWITPVKIRKLAVGGSEGYLEMDYISQQIEFYKSNYDKFKESANGFSDYILKFSESEKEIIPVIKKEPLTEEILSFINSVKKNKITYPDYAVNALKIALH